VDIEIKVITMETASEQETILSGREESANKGVSLHEDHVFLMGRPPLGEALGFLKTQSIGDRNTDIKLLADEWREANDHVKGLIKTEGNICSSVDTKPIPDKIRNRIDKVYADPIFNKSFNVLPCEIRLVKLDNLVVYQKTVNLDHIRRLKKKLSSNPTDEEIFDLCLSSNQNPPPVHTAWLSNNVIQFTSLSNDLRFLEGEALESDNVSWHCPGGTTKGCMGLFVGYGAGYVNVISVNGRLILNNGMHRAYTLRSLGIEYMPAIVQNVTREEEIPVVFNKPEETRKDCIDSNRPPVLKDFFDSELMKHIKMTSKVRLVTVGWNIEQRDIPIGNHGMGV